MSQIDDDDVWNSCSHCGQPLRHMNNFASQMCNECMLERETDDPVSDQWEPIEDGESNG